jgi:hypothetical protein
MVDSLHFSEKNGWTVIFLPDQIIEQTNIFDEGIQKV